MVWRPRTRNSPLFDFLMRVRVSLNSFLGSIKAYKMFYNIYMNRVIRMSKMEKDKKPLTKDRMIGMQVYDSQGNAAGTVQDIAFAIGKVGQTLIVEMKSGETKEYDWEEIQAAGDIVILKAPKVQAQPLVGQAAMGQPAVQQAQTGQSQICPTCGGPLTFIPQYQRWYCYRDKKYV